MAKPSADFVRFQTALIAGLLGAALSVSSIADEVPTADLPPAAANDSTVSGTAIDAEIRLSAVEKQLAELHR